MSNATTLSTLFLLDTNVISDMMRNPSGVAAQTLITRIRGNPSCHIATSVIVQCELLFGMRRRTSERWQQQYRVAMEGIEVLPLESDAAENYARLRTTLEARGTPIGANDTLIAAHALALSATLVSADTEFSRVPGLTIENWLQPS